MALKLSVSMNEGEQASSQEYLFQGERVTIGREKTSHLMLPAVWVRPTHAIVDRMGGRCQLVVSGWDEITFLNGESIVDEQPCPLEDGDVLRIGSFQIEVQLLNRSPTIFGENEGNHENPFAGPVNQLLDAFESVSETYEQVSIPDRDHALEEALNEAHCPISTHPAVRRSLDGLRGEGGDPSFGTATTQSEEEHAPSIQRSTHFEGESGTPADVLGELAEALAITLEVPAKFRHEFIGHPLTHPPDTKFLYQGSGSKIKRRLTDSSASPRKQRKRLQYVKEAAESVARHQVAVIQGYKASVITGVQELLQRLDPDAHQEDVVEGSSIFEHAPILASPKVLDRVRKACHDLLQDDWSVAEQRVFRPAFTRAYLAQITSPHASGKDAERSNVES